MRNQAEEIKKMQHLILSATIMNEETDNIKNYKGESGSLIQMSLDIGKFLIRHASINSILYGTFKEISKETGDEQYLDYFNSDPTSLFFRELRNMLLHVGVDKLWVIPMINLDINFASGIVNMEEIKINIFKESIIDYLDNDSRMEEGKRDIIKTMLSGFNETIDIYEMIKNYNKKVFELSKKYNNTCEVKFDIFK